MTDPISPIVAIGTKYQEAARPLMAQLAQIAEAQDKAYKEKFGALADSVNRPAMLVSAGVAKERADIRRQLDVLAQQAQAEARVYQVAATNGVVSARLAEYGDDAGRLADLFQAEQLSKTRHPDRLQTEFWQALNGGDVRTAAIRLRATLVSKDAPLSSVTNRMESELQAMNDIAIPERATALAAWKQANDESFKLSQAASVIERDAAQLAGDSAKAAAVNANRKVADFMATRRGSTA